MNFTLLGEHACRWTNRWKICLMSLLIALQHPIILFVCCLSTAPVSFVWVLQQATHRLKVPPVLRYFRSMYGASILRRIGVEFTPTTSRFWSCIRPNHETLRTNWWVARSMEFDRGDPQKYCKYFHDLGVESEWITNIQTSNRLWLIPPNSSKVYVNFLAKSWRSS